MVGAKLLPGWVLEAVRRCVARKPLNLSEAAPPSATRGVEHWRWEGLWSRAVAVALRQRATASVPGACETQVPEDAFCSDMGIVWVEDNGSVRGHVERNAASAGCLLCTRGLWRLTGAMVGPGLC
jgi:hypothetical protein